MVSIEDIPVELRWEIAAKAASAAPFTLQMALKDILVDELSEIELKLWMDSAKEAADLALILGLPVYNARKVSEAQGIVATILYGPELKYENVNNANDQVLDRITECPFLNRATELEADNEGLFEVCQSTNKVMVENLNPDYTQRFTKSMCLGDECCETCTELRKEL